MKDQLRAFVAAGCCLFASSPAMGGGSSSGHPGEFTELRVGQTDILCYQEPCPRNGVARTDRPAGPSDLLWSGDVPPPMSGAAGDRMRLLESYGEGCMLIMGRFEQGVLEVAEILGPC